LLLLLLLLLPSVAVAPFGWVKRNTGMGSPGLCLEVLRPFFRVGRLRFLCRGESVPNSISPVNKPTLSLSWSLSESSSNMVFFEDDDGAVFFFREVFVDFFFGLENVPPDGRLRTREEDRVFRFCGIGLPGEEGVLLVALPFFAEEGLAAALPLLGVRLKGDFLLGVDCVVEDNIALREWLYTCLLLRVLTMSAISFQLGPHFL
jgi:hypothetical protein